MCDGRDYRAFILFDLINHEHGGRRVRLLKIVSHGFLENRRSKRTERLALFDPGIQDIFHLSTARINNNATITESPWPKFHPALKPTNDFPVGNSLSRQQCELLIAQFAAIKIGAPHHTFDLSVCEFGSGIRMFHHKRSWLLQNNIVDVVTDAEGGTGIPCRRLHEHLSEWSVEQNLSVHHRVICDSAG